MAKLFYTLDEAAAKLGQTPEEVRQMAASGRIQEFRDRDKLMFKVDQIDLLAASMGRGEAEDDADMSGVIPLADSFGGELGLAGSSAGSAAGSSAGTGLGMSGGGESFGDKIDLSAESGPGGGAGMVGASGSRSGVKLSDSNPKQKSKSGVSIFDADDLEKGDPGAVTQMSGGVGLDDLSLEPVGSGSGLMELARESDDTSLGAAEFLQEVSDETAPELPAGASGLFRATSEEPDLGVGAAPAALAAVPAEPFDGPGSGLVGGLCVGAVAALAVGLTAALVSMTSGGTISALTDTLASSFWIVVGALAGLTLIGGGVGFVLGKRA